jgi:hypothetical protein
MPADAPAAQAWLERALVRAREFRGGTWDRVRLVAALQDEPAQSPDAGRLADPETVAVVCGQQPAVGGGPLYTLVKAAHAVATADALAARGRPAVAVFWCASEDHDLGEAGHADLVQRDGTVVRVAHGLGGGRASLRFRPAAAWWDALVARCRDALGPGAGEEFLRAHAPRGEEGMGAWLNRLLGAVFPRLVRVEGHRLRPLWTGPLGTALSRWPAAALAAARRERLAQGDEDAFGELPEPPLFADRADGRAKLTSREADALLEKRPLELSPGAALRPVLQQAALPAALYLGGPGELAYHAFITPLYAALGVLRPELLPRASLALAPSWFERALAPWQFAPEAMREDTQTPRLPDERDALDGPLAALDQALAALERAASGRPRVASRLPRLRRAQRRIAAGLQLERRHQRELAPFGPLRDWLFPRGAPQERLMSLFQALWEHGPGLGAQLVASTALLAPGERAVLRLGR